MLFTWHARPDISETGGEDRVRCAAMAEPNMGLENDRLLLTVCCGSITRKW